MKTADFYFDLPKELIAQAPPERRGDSRLLVCDRASGELTDTVVAELPRFLPSGALLVFNNSRVRKARVFAESETGGRVEFLFTRRKDDSHWEAVTSKQKKQTVGKRYRFSDGTIARICEAKERSRILEFDAPVTEDFFERNGAVPLPYSRTSLHPRTADRIEKARYFDRLRYASRRTGDFFAGHCRKRRRSQNAYRRV